MADRVEDSVNQLDKLAATKFSAEIVEVDENVHSSKLQDGRVDDTTRSRIRRGRSTKLSELPEAEMPLFYGAADALLLPSRYEGFGLPALEAMAAGCPVIASNVSALPEVTGEAAILVPPDDPEAWYEAVLRLRRDDRLRRNLVETGRERAARYTWDACATRTLAVYRRSLEKSPASR
jgi:glycosyltransferase involved in cell wall biosynthesis